MSGARSTAAGLSMPVNEPTIVLLNIDLLWRADPGEVGPSMPEALHDLIGGL